MNSLSVCVFWLICFLGDWGKSSAIPPLVDCSWLLLRMIGRSQAPSPTQVGLGWKSGGTKLVVVLFFFTCVALRDGTSLAVPAAPSGQARDSVESYFVKREMPCLHSLGRGLWSIPQRVARRGVGPAPALPSQWCTVSAGTRNLCRATRACPLSWTKPLIRPFVKCSVVLCLYECSPVGSGGPGAAAGQHTHTHWKCVK